MNTSGDIKDLSKDAQDEMICIGMLDHDLSLRHPLPRTIDNMKETLPVNRVSADSVLNEAFDYMKPSSFSRAVSFDIGFSQILLISGTASVGSRGETEYPDDFDAQQWRTYRNITSLLNQNGMTWHNVMWTSNYLRDIDRDYDKFNVNRTRFYNWLGLHPLPASLGIEAKLCRSDLLVEISGMAIANRDVGPTGSQG